MKNGQPLRAQGYSTIAPGIAFDIAWLQAFFKACVGCQVRIVSYHLGHNFNSFFLTSGMPWLRTFTLLIPRIWLITLPSSTILLTCPSGWQNLPARFVVTCLPRLVWRLIELHFGCYRISREVHSVMKARFSPLWPRWHSGWTRLRGLQSISLIVCMNTSRWNCNIDLTVSGVMTAGEININPLNALMKADGTPTDLGRLYIGS